jgi:hypothetical protein
MKYREEERTRKTKEIEISTSLDVFESVREDMLVFLGRVSILETGLAESMSKMPESKKIDPIIYDRL